MAAKLIAPTDVITGLPYPIAPKCEYLPPNRPDIADEHHGYHDRVSLIQRGIAGVALRNSWIQLIERDLHNVGPLSYHDRYHAVDLDLSDEQVFARGVLACAGAMADHVIDLRNFPDVVRPITRKEADFLRTPSLDPEDTFGYRYIRYSYQPIREFFTEYATSQDLGHIPNKIIDEFLLTKDSAQKMKLGKLLLRNAIAVASDKEDLRDKYKYLKKAGRLHPGMPHDPQTLVGYKLGGRDKEARIHNLVWKLRASLEAKYDIGLQTGVSTV